MPNAVSIDPTIYIGALRKRILIEQPVLDIVGDTIWEPAFAGRIWADITPLSGFELFRAQQIYPGSHTTIVIRYRNEPPGMKWETCRVNYNGHFYDIIDHHNVEERNRVIELSCVERPAVRAT